MRTTLLATAAAVALLAAPLSINAALAQQANTRDGTPGNPPSTATQRAADAATGNRTPADGTPGNPPGTALGRAAADANNRAGDPLNLQNRPDGTPGNPPGTAAGRALDNAGNTAAGANARAGDPANTQNRPDGTPGNPPGTAATRAIDRAVGTNLSGANPQNADGTASNPPGTAIGRAFDRTTQGNERTPGDRSTVSGNAATNANPSVMGSTQPNASSNMGAQTGSLPRDNSATSDMAPRAGATNTQPQNSAATAAPNNPPATESPRTATGTQPSAAMGSGVTGGAATTGAATTGAATTGAAATNAAAPSERASRIIGSNVYNERNESVGSVDDLILGGDHSGPMAIVSVGGFLGIGAKLVAVPFSQLRWNGGENRWTITGATRESLTSLPAYNYDNARRG